MAAFRTWQNQTDWAAGTLSNLNDAAVLQVPTLFAPSLASGSLSGSAFLSGPNITLPSTGAFTGESHPETGKANFYNGTINTRCNIIKLAQAFVPTYNGVLGTVSGIDLNSYIMSPSGNGPVTVSINADSGGNLGGVLATQTFTLNFGNGADQPLSIPTATFNVALSGGVRYWIVVTIGILGGNQGLFGEMGYSSPTWSSGLTAYMINQGSWSIFGPSPDYPTHQAMAATYSFTKTVITASGTWTSPVYDSHCTTESAGMKLAVTGSYPGSSVSVQVQGSTTGVGGWVTTDTLTSPSGLLALTGGQYRYWRIVYTLTTADNLNVPTITAPSLYFGTTGTWISEVLNFGSRPSGFSPLIISDSLGGGTVAYSTRTSDDGSIWDGWVGVSGGIIGSTPREYFQMQAALNAAGGTPQTISIAVTIKLSQASMFLVFN